MEEKVKLPEPHKMLGQLTEIRRFGPDGGKVIETHDQRYAVYTAEQVRQAVLEERERCARLADDYAAEDWIGAEGARRCAAAIRRSE